MHVPRLPVLSVFPLLPFLLAALLVLPVPPAGADEAEADRAKALIDGGRPGAAVPILERAVAEAPDDPRLHFLLGMAYHRTGRVHDAIAHLEHAATLEPGNGRTRYNLGAAYFAADRFEAAATAFLAVPERAPDLAAAGWLNAGLARAKQGRRDAARELFRKAVAADPSSKAADTAGRMLALLDWTEPAGPENAAEPGAEAASDVAAAERKGPPPAWRQALRGRLEVGREFDTNVFSLPDTDTGVEIQEEHDWRTALRARVETRVPLGTTLRFTPRYDFYGRWYDKQTRYDYRRHRALLRLDWKGIDWEPRLEYVYSYSEFGPDPYMNTHQLGARVALWRAPGRRIWAAVHAERDEAPGIRYDYLSGNEWEASVSGFTPVGGGGDFYAELALRRVDRGTLRGVTTTTPGGAMVTAAEDYSYTGVEPYAYLSRPLPWQLTFTGTLRYELRRYANPDTWTGGPGGGKRRQDQRVTGTLAVSRPVWKSVEVELGWEGQVRESNIGDRNTDYTDWDYTRQVLGVFLRAER